MRMLKMVLAMMVLSSFCLYGYAVESAYNIDKNKNVKGWHILVEDADIDTTPELITQLATTYAQLAAEDQIEVLSASTGDTTQTVTVEGVDDSGDRITEDFTLVGTTAQLSTATFRYIDRASLDIECAGVVTIRRETDTFITSIAQGGMETQMAQHFPGHKTSYLSYWDAGVLTSTGSITFALRWYPDDADCLDTADGYATVDTLYINKAATSPYNSPGKKFAQDIKIPNGGWLAVYGSSSDANAKAKITLQGYDV